MESRVLTGEDVLRETVKQFNYSGNLVVKGDLPEGISINVDGDLKITGDAKVVDIVVSGNLEVFGELESYSCIHVGGDIKTSSITANTLVIDHDIHSHSDIIIKKSIISSGSIYSEGCIRTGGTIIVKHDLTAFEDIIASSMTAKNIKSMYGSLRAGGTIHANESIYAENLIRANQLEAGKDILSGENIKVISGVTSKGSISAYDNIHARTLETSGSISTKYGSIYSDTFIKADTIITDEDCYVSAGVECAEANLKTQGFIKANKINSTVKHGYVVS